MSLGLKTTLTLSLGLAVFLNIAQLEVSYARSGQASVLARNEATAAIPHAIARPVTAIQAAPPPTPAPAAAPTIPDAAATTGAKLTAAGLKPQFAAAYLEVQAKTGTPWQLLAAVHTTETGQSDDTTRRSYAGATGPLQFMPATFARYAQDGDGNGTKDITNLSDALLTAGRYLAAGGAARGNYSAALFNYNHSSAYVSHVLAIARHLGL